ncbi:hypothetical protein M422DRAFT_163968, partial [Sphaerobolus stellatus SS14]
LMVTMDAKEGIQLVQLIQPDITIPIHNDDYEMKAAGLEDKLVTLDRGDQYQFKVRKTT